jgi:hypothetical protein
MCVPSIHMAAGFFADSSGGGLFALVDDAEGLAEEGGAVSAEECSFQPADGFAHEGRGGFDGVELPTIDGLVPIDARFQVAAPGRSGPSTNGRLAIGDNQQGLWIKDLDQDLVSLYSHGAPP